MSFEIVVLFDNETLSDNPSSDYQLKFFFKTILPEKVVNSALFDGDMVTSSHDRHGVALQTNDAAIIRYIRDAFTQCVDKTLLPIAERFVEGQNVISNNRLMFMGRIDNNGNVATPNRDAEMCLRSSAYVSANWRIFRWEPMITVSVIINRPLGTVWDFFVEPSNWSKWRSEGSGLKQVIPSWKRGGQLIWENGEISTIDDVYQKQELYINSKMVDSKYSFKNAGPTATIVEYVTSKPKGGASFSDGGAAYKQRLESNFQKLKHELENVSSSNQESKSVKISEPQPHQSQAVAEQIAEKTASDLIGANTSKKVAKDEVIESIHKTSVETKTIMVSGESSSDLKEAKANANKKVPSDYVVVDEQVITKPVKGLLGFGKKIQYTVSLTLALKTGAFKPSKEPAKVFESPKIEKSDQKYEESWHNDSVM
jgi:hypothetical protein